MRAGTWLFALALACAADVAAAGNPPEPRPAAQASARYSLRAAKIEAAAPAGRFSLRGRAEPAASAGELRESARYVAIGRFAKAGTACNADAIFRNGFE